MIVQEILLKAYREIGDPDGAYGCGAGTLADPTSRWDNKKKNFDGTKDPSIYI